MRRRMLLLIVVVAVLAVVGMAALLLRQGGTEQKTLSPTPESMARTATAEVSNNATIIAANQQTVTALFSLSDATLTRAAQREATATQAAAWNAGTQAAALVQTQSARTQTAEAVIQSRTAEALAANRITGILTYPVGNPLAGVGIRLYRDNGDGSFEPFAQDEFLWMVTTSADGSYSFDTPGRGLYWLEIAYYSLPETVRAKISPDMPLVIQAAVPSAGAIRFEIGVVSPTPPPSETPSPTASPTGTATPTPITPSPPEITPPQVATRTPTALPTTGGGGVNLRLTATALARRTPPSIITLTSTFEPGLNDLSPTVTMAAVLCGDGICDPGEACTVDCFEPTREGTLPFTPVTPGVTLTPSETSAPVASPTRRTPPPTPGLTSTPMPTIRPTRTLAPVPTKSPTARPTRPASPVPTTTNTPEIQVVAALPVRVLVSGVVIGDGTLRLFAPDRASSPQTARVELELRLDNRYITPTPAGPVYSTTVVHITSTPLPGRATPTPRVPVYEESGQEVFERMGASLRCLPSSFEGCAALCITHIFLERE